MSSFSYLNKLEVGHPILVRLSDSDREAVDSAIADVLVSNSFLVSAVADTKAPSGPFAVKLSDEDGRLGLSVADVEEHICAQLIVSLAPFRRHIRDYIMICDSYYEAIREGAPHQIEAIDMARRGIHDEAAELLKERLNSKITMDFDTARRLFTLLSTLKMVG